MQLIQRCYSIVEIVCQEWKDEVKANGMFSKKNKPFITWLEKKLEAERIKNLKPAGDIPKFMLK
jgi:hypothetical protein